MKRRDFFHVAALGVGTLAWSSLTRAADETFKFKKAQIVAFPDDKTCEKLKSAGYDGMEVTRWDIPATEAEKGRKIAEKFGLKVHSVMRGWTNVNDPNKEQADIATVKTALQTAAVYGADSVLWVPCKIGNFLNPSTGRPDKPAMPAAWEFDIDFDPQTLKVNTVADGDNTPYAEYITAQNTATEATLRAIEELAPVAESCKVILGIENVWNNLWSTPKFFAALTLYSQSPFVAPYLDLGNHTMYAAPQEWVKALGAKICKLHIKGFKVEEVRGKLGGGPGGWCPIDKASIDWKVVRQALDAIRYNGWISVEEGNYSYEEYAQILDRIW
ncbi:hypothetical protein FACS1894170_06050 [Planctomycetales bacterium]|nr:hypothetical protein FACS1894170_06050 [Planctomycetales bacterium]